MIPPGTTLSTVIKPSQACGSLKMYFTPFRSPRPSSHTLAQKIISPSPWISRAFIALATLRISAMALVSSLIPGHVYRFPSFLMVRSVPCGNTVSVWAAIITTGPLPVPLMVPNTLPTRSIPTWSRPILSILSIMQTARSCSKPEGAGICTNSRSSLRVRSSSSFRYANAFRMISIFFSCSIPFSFPVRPAYSGWISSSSFSSSS